MIRRINNILKIKYATLTVEDEKGSVMTVEIDTDELSIDNYLEEPNRPYPAVGMYPQPRHVSSRFTLRTDTQYVVSYDQKVK